MKILIDVSACSLVAALFLVGADKASAACEPGPGQVAFYEHANYKGACVVLGVGKYNNSAATGMKNDSISSAKLGPNTWAISYKDSGFKGISYRHEKSEKSFPAVTLLPVYNSSRYKHGDQTSSIEVLKINTSRPGPAPVVKYLGNHPSNRSNGWSNALQGVAHDQSNWFFTQKELLWKFPESHDLNSLIIGSLPFGSNVEVPLPEGVKKAPIPRGLRAKGYNHLGDLVHHNGYLFIPLEAEDGSNRKNPLLAVYRGADLSFVGSAPLNKQTKAGWFAINPTNGLLYTSNLEVNTRNQLIVYRVDFAGLNHNQVKVQFQRMQPLYDENGREIKLLPYMQGGEFSDDGKYLFLINGRIGNKTSTRNAGIWVFDFKTGKKVLKSAGSGDFKFEYHPKAPKFEEPEGLTYWNLGNGNAPNIEGNLHVILLNKHLTTSDGFWLKHYRVGNIKAVQRCEASRARLCANNGARCEILGKNDGSKAEVCRWTNANSGAACNKTSGIWTTPNSKYAKNHPGAVASGSYGACLTEVNNILSKVVEELNTQGGMVIMNPFRASSTANEAGAENTPPQEDTKSVLAAPSDLQVSDITSTKLKLSWMDNSDHEFGVELYRTDPDAARRNQKGSWKFIGLFEERVGSNVRGAGRRSDEDFELDPNTNYCYRLRAYSGFDRSEVSVYSKPICAKTKISKDENSPGLAAPSDLQVSDLTDTTLTLSWADNAEGEYGVELYRLDPVAARQNRELNWVFIGLFEERIDSNVKGSGRRSDQDYELEPDTNYCYRLRAYSGFDRAKVSDFSDKICTKTNK